MTNWKLGDRAVITIHEMVLTCDSCRQVLERKTKKVFAEGEVTAVWTYTSKTQHHVTRIRVDFNPEFEYVGGSAGCRTVDADEARRPEIT